MDHVLELLREMRDNWNDRYWWAHHPELQVAVISVISGLFTLLFAYFEVRVRQLAAQTGGLS